jgi:hypothetical protein
MMGDVDLKIESKVKNPHDWDTLGTYPMRAVKISDSKKGKNLFCPKKNIHG